MPYKLPLANDWDPVFDSNRQNSLNDHFLQQTMYLMRNNKRGRSRMSPSTILHGAPVEHK
jgi:hypothetical protein